VMRLIIQTEAVTDVPIGTGDGVPLSGMISIIVSYALPKAQAQ
jgi:hypothetical protein